MSSGGNASSSPLHGKAQQDRCRLNIDSSKNPFLQPPEIQIYYTNVTQVCLLAVHQQVWIELGDSGGQKIIIAWRRGRCPQENASIIQIFCIIADQRERFNSAAIYGKQDGTRGYRWESMLADDGNKYPAMG